VNNADQAMLVVILTASWQHFSYNFLFYFAALKGIPQSLIDAATIDGASSRHPYLELKLALFVILFVYGWNQYLWSLVITIESKMATIVMGIRYLAGVADQIPQWHYIMTVAFIALIPPCMVVVIMQRWFEKGLKYVWLLLI
jgi:sn-glycerol 3-phosphate transport system permease protein